MLRTREALRVSWGDCSSDPLGGLLYGAHDRYVQLSHTGTRLIIVGLDSCWKSFCKVATFRSVR